MLISPTPLFLRESHTIFFTLAPCFSLYHAQSLYVSSYRLYSRTTGRMEVSVFAVCSSDDSRASTVGSGKLSIISACLLLIELCSHAETGSVIPFFFFFSSDSTIRQWRNFHHSSLALIFLSNRSFPSLYFFRVSAAFLTSSSVRFVSFSFSYCCISSCVFGSPALPSNSACGVDFSTLSGIGVLCSSISFSFFCANNCKFIFCLLNHIKFISVCIFI